MKRPTFEQRLKLATLSVINYTRSLVNDRLPNEALYLIRPNASNDDNPLLADEIVFPEDSLPKGHAHLPPMDAEGAVRFLWRVGERVPAWINVQIARADADYTYLLLTCCGRFTSGRQLYHRASGMAPFNGQSPPFPQEWVWIRHMAAEPPLGDDDSPSIEEMITRYGRFDLGNRTLMVNSGDVNDICRHSNEHDEPPSQ